MSFNLTQEPWIPVVSQDFQLQEVSLIELFENWENLKEIQADNPPTTLALYRLLFAMLHYVYQGPVDEEHWEEIYEDNGRAAIAYLQEKRNCFDLLHPEYPFMQDPILDQVKPVPIYAIHTMSQNKVFSHEHEWSGYTLSLSEAARLLVRLQGVDVTSLRAFYVGQSSGNRSAVNTPPINATNVLVQGINLKQILSLNLIRYDPSAEFPSVVEGKDLPTWEIGYASKPSKTVPAGYIHYLTFPWRRLKLFIKENRVDEIAITKGDSFPEKVSAQQWECGIPYREGKPVRLSLEKQLWRNADCFILSAQKTDRPRIIDWLAKLSEDLLSDNQVHLKIIGLSADKAKPLGWTIERLSLPKLYISDRELATSLKQAIDIAENHQQVFRSFRGSPYFSLAEILKHDKPASLAKALDGESRYWATLDRAFPFLLDALPQDARTEEADGITRYGYEELPKWTKTVQNAAREAFTASIESIRDYKARAAALRALEWQLRKLRGEDKDAKGSGKAKKKTAA